MSKVNFVDKTYVNYHFYIQKAFNASNVVKSIKVLANCQELVTKHFYQSRALNNSLNQST